MSYAENPYRADHGVLAIQASDEERASFITRTYLHLAGAVAVFVAIEAFLLNLPGIGELAATMTNGWNWLIVMGAFFLASYVAQSWANSATSLGMQYLGLGVYVVVEAFIFMPLLYVANTYDPMIIPASGLITLMLFTGLTAIVFITRKDFSFLRSVLWFAGLVAFGLIACSILFNFSLGAIFSVVMIGFAAGYILYYTSNVLYHFRVDQHVAAALALFAAGALLFWYVVRIVLAVTSRD